MDSNSFWEDGLFKENLPDFHIKTDQVTRQQNQNPKETFTIKLGNNISSTNQQSQDIYSILSVKEESGGKVWDT
jgi:hypothetical protein